MNLIALFTLSGLLVWNLFVPAPNPIPAPMIDSNVIRHRYVKLSQMALYLLPKANRITLNLFPDTKLIGVITGKSTDDGVLNYRGYLVNDGKRIDKSYFLIVRTAGVYIIHAAGPGFVYEVSLYKGKVYRVVQLGYNNLQD